VMPTGYQILKQESAHFLTFQVVNWVDLFSRKRYRDILVGSLNYCISKKGLIVYSYVIMSNHVHLLIQAEDGSLSALVRDIKKYSSGRILSSIQNDSESRKDWLLKLFSEAAGKHVRNEHFQVWTHENHAEEIYSNKFTWQKVNYIHENPVRAGIVRNAEDYLYSSAVNYSGEKGFVAVTVLNLHSLMI
jgi:REP element-mobilizing transposase RayT